MNTSNAMSLGDIEGRARNYRTARDLLGDRLRQLDDKIEAYKREAMPLIRTALAATKAAESELTAGITDNPQHFRKPRTHVFHGVRVGFEKGKGSISIPDPEQTVKLIKKHFPEQVELLVKTTEKPRKNAIADLSAADAKRIGCHITAAGDAVVIKPVDSELDKMLNALLKADQPEAGEDDE